MEQEKNVMSGRTGKSEKNETKVVEKEDSERLCGSNERKKRREDRTKKKKEKGERKEVRK